MSHEQARAKWPDDHLWWHSDAHCYDNRRHGAEHYEDNNARNDLVHSVPQMGDHGAPVPADQAAPGVHTVVYYPALDVNAWPVTILPMQPADMTTWPILLDVDQPARFGAWRDRITGAWRAP